MAPLGLLPLLGLRASLGLGPLPRYLAPLLNGVTLIPTMPAWPAALLPLLPPAAALLPLAWRLAYCCGAALKLER